jgi:Ca2+-binding RTX toxin-like protein
MMFESVESRRLLSGGGAGKGNAFDPHEYGPAVIVQEGSTLTITNAHSVRVNAVYEGPEEAPGAVIPGEVAVVDFGGLTTTFYSGITTVVVVGTRDADIITASVEGFDATFDGGNGGDQISVSNNGSGTVTVFGGKGNDAFASNNNSTGTLTIHGGAGRDTLLGGRGVTFIQ